MHKEGTISLKSIADIYKTVQCKYSALETENDTTNKLRA